MTDKKFKIVFTDFDFPSIDIEKDILSEIECEFVTPQTNNEEKLIEICRDADALFVQYAQITERVINSMTKCKVISRFGIGVDSIDLKAAKAKGIYVCNVPDYCINEVADHSLAIILSLGRKIVQFSNSVREGIWDTLKVGKPIYNLQNQILGLIGFGKIPQNLFKKASNLFKEILVYDPFILHDVI
ncbi:MAG: C-terminal binding protein, partial [Cyanobacteria bacterium]|nr:C-terminal binding protein [Cyanobacteriota bacterium]